jgi:hypothetical protein
LKVVALRARAEAAEIRIGVVRWGALRPLSGAKWRSSGLEPEYATNLICELDCPAPGSPCRRMLAASCGGGASQADQATGARVQVAVAPASCAEWRCPSPWSPPVMFPVSARARVALAMTAPWCDCRAGIEIGGPTNYECDFRGLIRKSRWPVFGDPGAGFSLSGHVCLRSEAGEHGAMLGQCGAPG